MPISSPYYVYILRCSDDTLYTGITTDLERRLDEHNHSPKGAKYTRNRRPVALVYSEPCSNKSAASKREYAIKQLKRSQKEELLLRRVFTMEPMLQVSRWLETQLQQCSADAEIAFEVVDPDHGAASYAGKQISVEGIEYLYRGYKAWSDLAELHFCRMLTPKAAEGGRVLMRFQRLDTASSFHSSENGEKTEKYGTASAFSSINKNEEPAFLLAYKRALEAVKIASKQRILNLGVNTGDEFALIRDMTAAEEFEAMELVGIDHSASAIEAARTRFASSNVSFHVHDINHLDALELGRFDLLISIGTLQSPGIDFKPLFMSLVQEYLVKNEGAMILGFPNCRWIDGEMVYGAKAPNYSYSELSLLMKDLYFCKKYLQQKRYRVTITGKDYLFLTATPIRKPA
jgi:predicted GIY-YIG superfamily endonuclease/SAM-dependent methyltransferase